MPALADGSQQLIYATNGLFRQEKLQVVATEWTRVASTSGHIVILQTFELPLANALAHEILALPGDWGVLAYEACNAAGARVIVLQRGVVIVPAHRLL